MSLQRAADRALAALFRAMDGTASYQRAELALTLHMLEFLAPRFFLEHRLAGPLGGALTALGRVPAAFGPRLEVDEAMARLDALYLRAVRGLPSRRFDRRALRRCVARAERQQGKLWRWLMGELAAPLGVDAALRLEARWPFEAQPTLHLYHLTHLVLVQTEYLRIPVPAGLGGELQQLRQALEPLARAQSYDLLAECGLCLNRAGLRADRATEALRAAQRPDGSFAEAGSSPRVAAHCTAAGMLALAGALDLERSAP